MGATISTVSNEAHNYMFGVFMFLGWIFLIGKFQELVSSGKGIFYIYIVFGIALLFITLDIIFCSIVLQNNKNADASIRNGIWLELAGNSIGIIVLAYELFTAHKKVYGGHTKR